MIAKVIRQKWKILAHSLGVLLIILFFEVFLALPFSFAIVNYWLDTVSPEKNTSFFFGILLHAIGLFFLWAVRSFTGALFRSFSRLFPLLFVFSYIEKSALAKPVEPEKNADDALKLEYTFHPYKVIDETVSSQKETTWEMLKGYFAIAIVLFLFYLAVQSSLHQYIIPSNRIAQMISFALAAVLQIILSFLPSNKLQEQKYLYDSKNS